jgi:DNA-binding NtrC family response regulator
MQSLTHDELLEYYHRLEARGDLLTAQALAAQMARFYEEREDFKYAGIWYRRSSVSLGFQGNYDEAAAKAEMSAEIQPDLCERALSFIQLADSQYFASKHKAGFIALNKAEEIVRSIPENVFLKAHFYGIKAVTFCCNGDIDQAIINWKNSANLMLQIGPAWRAACQFNCMGFELARHGRLKEAEQQLLRALEYIHRNRHLPTEAGIQDSIGYTYTMMGKYDDAERWLNESARIFENIPDKAQLIGTLLHLSELRERTGNGKAAREAADRAMELATEIKLNDLYTQAQNRRSNIEPDMVRSLNKHGLFHGLVYVSDKMKFVAARLKAIAATDEIVLVLGETGTGKELAARAIHEESNRRNHLFVAFNCSALSRELVESRLFGHRKGAFTGADREHSGVIGAAEGGTLFLDEIGDLTLDAQGALLRFLQSGEIQPVGASKPVMANVRVIAATNRDLRQEVEAGHFRRDLYYRLNAITLYLPPLWSHREDVPELVIHFAQLYGKKYNLPDPAFTEDEMTKLIEYEWRGNVRELENYVKQRVLFGEASLQTEGANGNGHQPDWRRLTEAEKHRRIIEALANNSGNITAAARCLRISRRTIQKLRRRLT